MFHVGRERGSGSNSKEQRARVSGPLRLLSVEKLASLPLCDCRTSVQHGKSGKIPLIFYSEGKQTLTFNAAVSYIWTLCLKCAERCYGKYVDMTCKVCIPCYLQTHTQLIH